MIYNGIMKYWTHHCIHEVKAVPVNEVCDHCGINQAVESLRFRGHNNDTALPAIPKQKPKVSKLAWLLMKKKRVR